jgi:hypothetical protein
MMNKKALQTHFSDDPTYDESIDPSAVRPIKSPALLAVLAALHDEFRSILNQNAFSPTTDTEASAAAQ